MINAVSKGYMIQSELYNALANMMWDNLDIRLLYGSLMDEAYIMYKKGEITPEEFNQCKEKYELATNK